MPTSILLSYKHSLTPASKEKKPARLLRCFYGGT